MIRSSDNSAENGIKKVIFIILVILSIHIWELRYIPQLIKSENLLVWMICIFSFFLVMGRSNMKFKYAILLFLTGLVLNTMAAYMNLGQSPVKTILAFEYSYFILIYFLLHYLNLSRKFLENTIIAFAIIYSVVFLAQYAVYPTIILRSDKNTAVLSKQFEILGSGFLVLGYLLSLNRYLIYRGLKNILLAVGFIIILFLSDFRTLLAGAAVVTLLLLLRIVHRPKDIIKLVFVVLILFGLTQYQAFTKIINNMVAQTENNIKEGEKYVRFVELEFFLKRYPQNISYFIIGGGRASGENLYRYNREAAFGMNYNIVWVDIGLIGYYIVIGGIATLGLLWYSLKAISIKLPRDRLYLNLYFLYLIIVSFTNEEIFRDGIFTVQAIALYLIDISSVEKSDTVETAPETGTVSSANP
jgi:hypothetical protein